ncbi:GFA family protein [Poseidonocella sp. HB161398]|uniref:GFA family protein n=1 Tax=Poseidonocella sp. HB161398 TaxID=2320855 RepID=UPI001107B1F2|nr:GFA family protein [Poseidonocella sp. HB161398]
MKATCHCGAVELEVELCQTLESAQRCDCSFCRRRGAATVSAPLDGLRVLKGQEVLTQYSWGTGTAQHWFCSVCGIYTHHRRRSDPTKYGINLGTLEGVNPSGLGLQPWSDGVNHPSDRLPDAE